MPDKPSLKSNFDWSIGLEWERKRGAASKSALLRSHDKLRAALVVAGKEIRKLNFGRSDTPVLKLLRRVLREARMVAAAEKGKPA
jgi:hypothetical protein